MSTCDVFNCLFPLNIVQNEIQLLSRVFCYSWLVCLSGFWLGFLMRKRVEKSEAKLALLDSFQCISNGKHE